MADADALESREVTTLDVNAQTPKPGAKTLYAWLSVALLFVALVVPVAQAPIIGTINVFGLQDGTAYWFLAFAIIAALATFAKFYRLLPIPGVFVIGTILYYAYHLEKLKSDLVKNMQGNMFAGLAQGMAATIHLQWGVAVLIIAGVALIVAGILRNDAETLPQLFAANRMQFIEGGIGVAVLFLGIAILPTVLPHPSSQARAQSNPVPNPFAATGAATTDDASTPAPDPKVRAMRESISVGILEKGFHNKDIYNGDFDDDFAVKTQYHNLSRKTISGVKGTLSFYDQFGSRITGFKIEYEKDLRPGAVIVVPEYYKYNQFMERDQKLRAVPLAKLKIVWEPQRVNFADGSSLSARDQ
jgi:hypothetical protein